MNRTLERSLFVAISFVLLASSRTFADGPADNDPARVRQVPPPGIEIGDDDRARLESGLAALAGKIDSLRKLEKGPAPALLPDVEIFHRAVDQALRFGEMYSPRDVREADRLLAEGNARAESLLADEAPWTTERGLVVRGFRSRLDGTVQPYGLVIPENYEPGGARRYRLDLWFHGRGEKTLELQFISERMSRVGPIRPVDTIVLHPFGRYSNAFKLAGEVDVWEALEHAKRHYSIDEDRIAVRGFSMGGAGVWHFAVHHPDRFFAATPGAGFSETPEFLKTFQAETLDPPWWEETLWRWYDCPPWVGNLRHCPTIAYSGEIDRQKQAADVMVDAFRRETRNKLELVHIIGPKTAHALHPDALAEIESRLERIASTPRRALPRRVRFTTYTLRYNQVHWITINGLDRHWERAEVDAQIGPHGEITVEEDGVNDLTIHFPPGALGDDSLLADVVSPLAVVFIDRTRGGEAPSLFEPDDPRLRVMSDGSFECRFVESSDGWTIFAPGNAEDLHKRHGLQGPIDDAFLDSFLFVTPSGKARHPAIGAWVESELERAVSEWRKQMRGDVPIKADTEVTDEDIRTHHLILWGDPSSNAMIARVLPSLPIEWSESRVAIGEASGAADAHVPVLIYPNPLARDRYVVLDSSFTYREYDYLNNARQTPKLPDWAIVDVREAPGTRWPGKIAAADFFGERWEVRKRETRR